MWQSRPTQAKTNGTQNPGKGMIWDFGDLGDWCWDDMIFGEFTTLSANERHFGFLNACCLMLHACCLMLHAYLLLDARREVGVQASGSKQQASIRHQAASIKQQALRNWALRLWQEIKKSCFPDSVSYHKISSLMRGCIHLGNRF